MINIMFAGNYKVFDGMLIASLSILKHTNDPISCYILTMERTQDNPNFIAINNKQIDYLQKEYSKHNKQSKVIKVDVSDLYEKYLGSSPNKTSSYTPYAFLRLLSDKISVLPDKILYLDTDVMAYHDISELYNKDISDYEVAMVKDYYGKVFINRNYCNSGVMLMNLAKIKETGMLERALEYCATTKSLLPDQTALHKALKSKLILPSKYNEQHKIQPDTVIRHFSMTLKFFPVFRKQNIKPWHIDKVHDVLKCHEFDDILDDYLSRKEEIDSLISATESTKIGQQKAQKKA